MDIGNHLRLTQHEQIVITAHILLDIGKTLTAIIFFFQFVSLNLRAHRTIKHQDTLGHLSFDTRASRELLVFIREYFRRC